MDSVVHGSCEFKYASMYSRLVWCIMYMVYVLVCIHFMHTLVDGYNTQYMYNVLQRTMYNVSQNYKIQDIITAWKKKKEIAYMSEYEIDGAIYDTIFQSHI